MKLTKLKEARLAAGLEPMELALKADMSQATIYKAESGKEIKKSTAKRLARAVGVKLEDLREVNNGQG